jgi:hypothetical protein
LGARASYRRDIGGRIGGRRLSAHTVVSGSSSGCCRRIYGCVCFCSDGIRPRERSRRLKSARAAKCMPGEKGPQRTRQSARIGGIYGGRLGGESAHGARGGDGTRVEPERISAALFDLPLLHACGTRLSVGGGRGGSGLGVARAAGDAGPHEPTVHAVP